MKIRAAVLLAAAGVLLGSALASCSSSASDSGNAEDVTAGADSTSAPENGAAPQTIPMLKIGFGTSFPTLDITKNINAGNVTSLVLDTLMKFGPEGQLEPNLATSVDQTSPTTYVYHLRQGAKFSNGNELTAEDVAYSLDYNRSATSKVAFLFGNVERIEATDRYTVTVTLKQPDAAWQYAPATFNSQIFEKQFGEAHKDDLGNPGVLVIGTGPWKIDSLNPTQGAELSANPHWWGGAAPIDRISMQFFSNENSAALAFRAGDVDFVPGVSDPQGFAATSGAPLVNATGCDVGFFAMNTTVSPWDDVHVRRAVAYALNRDDIIKANGGYATPIPTLIPPQMLLSIASKAQIDEMLQSIPQYEHDIEKAKQEMAMSAYPNGAKASIQQYDAGTNAAQVIAAQLKEIGIELEINAMEVTAWQSVQSGPKESRSTSFSGGGCFHPDPSMYTDFLGSKHTEEGQWNISVYAPADVDELIEAGVATTDAAERFETYGQLMNRLQEDLPYVGLFVQERTIALSEAFTYTDFNSWFWHTAYALNIKPKA